MTMDKSIFKKINFRQGKYVLPAVLYLPVLFVGWSVCDLFSDDDREPKSNLHTTQYLNSDLPDAAVDSTLGDKMDNVDKTFGGITDVTGVSNAPDDRDSVMKKEDYQSQYSDSEARAIAQQEQDRADLAEAQMKEREHNAKLREMQERVRNRAYRKRAGRSYDDGFVDPASDNAIAEAQRRRRERELNEIDRNLAASGNRYRGDSYQGANGHTPLVASRMATVMVAVTPTKARQARRVAIWPRHPQATMPAAVLASEAMVSPPRRQAVTSPKPS